MPDKFNPYVEWLGLPSNTVSPNHYQLLGIDETVTDQSAITKAAERVMTRVRACKPGQHAAVWAQLLDRISDAKETLADSSRRQNYDRQRLSPSAAPQAAAAPVAKDRAVAVNPNMLPPTANAVQPNMIPQPAAQAVDPMAPVAMTPQPATPYSNPATQAPAVPLAVPYLQPASPAAPDPMAPLANSMPAASPSHDPMAPVPIAPVGQPSQVPQAIPVAPAMPMQAQAAPISVQPVMPNAGPMLAAPSTTAAPSPTVGGTPKFKRKPTVSSRAHSKSGSLLGPILLGGSVGGLILVVVGVGFYLAGQTPDEESDPVAVVAPKSNDPSTVAPTTPRRLDEIPESERPPVEPYTPPSSVAMSTDTSPANVMQPSAMINEPAPTTTPSTPPPAMSTPTMEPETGPTREELRALAQALTTARDAVGELNFAAFDREIAKTVPLARLDEHLSKVNRLKLLRDYVGRFRGAIDETLARVNAGDQINIDDDKSFGIVEKTSELLVIRYGGRNLRYPLSELPPGLAIRLAEMSLDKTSPETAAMKAAYVAVNPKVGDSDLEKVRGWWSEAAAVPDIQDLITAIEDDYSLKQDITAVPLDPGAMSVLAERADRLKDARTLDEFAKEYQSAIDESLQTLEPGMELAVGGSTTVTVKELKDDRLMLTVVDETRGFQLSRLPLGLAASIAEQILPRDAPLTMVMKGAYFAAREKDRTTKQFRPIVLDLWKQAGETDQQLQPAIQALVAQYPE